MTLISQLFIFFVESCIFVPLHFFQISIYHHHHQNLHWLVCPLNLLIHELLYLIFVCHQWKILSMMLLTVFLRLLTILFSWLMQLSEQPLSWVTNLNVIWSLPTYPSILMRTNLYLYLCFSYQVHLVFHYLIFSNRCHPHQCFWFNWHQVRWSFLFNILIKYIIIWRLG